MRDVVRLSQDTEEHTDKEPSLTLDQSGRLWVAWQSYAAKTDRILARSLVDGVPGGLLEVSDEAGGNFQPALACDGESRVWVVWSAKRPHGWTILARPIVVGQVGEIIPLEQSATLACSPCVTADGCGRVWAAWTVVRNGRHQIFGARCMRGRWSEAMLLSDCPGECYRPTLVADQGGVWVAYETQFQGSYELFVRRWSLSTLGPQSRFSQGDAWEMHPRLCTDGQGGVWATWIVTHDVHNRRGAVDHKVEIRAAHYDGQTWTPYRGPFGGSDRTKPGGLVAPLYDGLLGRQSYWGFVGHRRRPQILRDEAGDVWVLYERKEDESINRRGPDALFYGRPLTGPGQARTYEVDTEAYAYAVNGALPAVDGRLFFAGQIPSGAFYGDICAGTLPLDRTRPVRTRPASAWLGWQPISLPDVSAVGPRPAIEVGGETYKLYWGDTHCHGSCSGDAEGEIDELYAYGRFKSGLDFMAITDNDVIYDDALTPCAWALLRSEAGQFNEPGRFVTLSGYERSYRDEPTQGGRVGQWRGTNHRIILYADDEQPICRHTEPDADTLDKFVAFTERTNAFVYPHHATWWLAPSSRLGGVEVCSSWDVYIHHADTIHQALCEGYRLAFIGSSDTHRIVPGMGGALTGVWAKELTREAIWEALWARRCYATHGERMVLDVRLDGAPMGSEGVVVDAVAVQCQAQAERVIEYVSLIRDGVQVQRRSVNEKKTTLVFEDAAEPGEHFYYVRVQLQRPPGARRYGAARGNRGNLQVARGDYAWSSPIWVRVAGGV